VSPDTGKPMFATPQDAPLIRNFNQAADYAGNLDAHGTAAQFRVAVHGKGVKVEIDADGNVTVYTNGGVKARPFEQPPTLVTSAPAEALKVGASMPDGSIYAGVSPDTGKPMFATPKDVPMHCNFNQTADYAANLDAHGHKDWRVPTKAELNVLFGNRAAIGGFDTSGSYPAGWYWSSSRCPFIAWVQRFSDGHQLYVNSRGLQSALRCVRG
jgi:hypothetical protein